MAHVYHWKHGWIPLDHTAALSKSKGNKLKADELVRDAHSTSAGIHSRRDVAGALLDLHNVPAADNPAARHDVIRSAAEHNALDLLPESARAQAESTADASYAKLHAKLSEKAQTIAESMTDADLTKYLEIHKNARVQDLKDSPVANSSDMDRNKQSRLHAWHLEATASPEEYEKHVKRDALIAAMEKESNRRFFERQNNAALQRSTRVATERQVEHIVNLLAARKRSGRGDGFIHGPTDRAAIRRMSIAEASAYIASLQGNY